MLFHVYFKSCLFIFLFIPFSLAPTLALASVYYRSVNIAGTIQYQHQNHLSFLSTHIFRSNILRRYEIY